MGQNIEMGQNIAEVASEVTTHGSIEMCILLLLLLVVVLYGIFMYRFSETVDIELC